MTGVTALTIASYFLLPSVMHCRTEVNFFDFRVGMAFTAASNSDCTLSGKPRPRTFSANVLVDIGVMFVVFGLGLVFAFWFR